MTSAATDTRLHHSPSFTTITAANAAATTTTVAATAPTRRTTRDLSLRTLPVAFYDDRHPPAVTVDSKPAVAAPSVKSRAHSRLASLGYIRSRGSIHQLSHARHPQTQVETTTAATTTTPIRSPGSPSDDGASAFNKPSPSDSDSRSDASSHTTLSDDAKSDYRSFDGDSPRPSASLASSNRSAVDFFTANTTNVDADGSPDARHTLDSNTPAPRRRPHTMHQTSSKLLRMTEDDRPFTRDFKDLFSTLMVSLPLTPHRVRFTRVEHTFTTEEATTNLASLKFSQSNRMPDPKDPSRIVTTTTTTTFSMAREMARTVCQRFLDARFIESTDGKSDFASRGSVWQLTPKGMQVLSRFCQRNGIRQRHITELLDSPRNVMQLVILEREQETDKLNHDPAMVNVIFRRFAGDTGPNVKSHSAAVTVASDSDSISDYMTGLVGVKMHRARRLDKNSPYVFTGKAAFDWLLDCCTIVDKREAFEIANLFITHGLIAPSADERHGQPAPQRFAASKHVLYSVTQLGMRAAGWITSPNGSINEDATVLRNVPPGVSRDSNANRMTIIVRDPALRLLFREYLRETHCEENLSFYVEVKAFLSDYESAKRHASPPKMDIIRETLASAYSLYNAFLAPGSPCELNIDHTLRNALAARMTRAVVEDEQMLKSLNDVAVLFDQAQTSVFKLMASDSVPKFSREPKYATILRDRNLESMFNSFAATSVN